MKRKPDRELLSKWIELYLLTLSQREQDIIKFLAILGPAIGGFFYLLVNRDSTAISGLVFNAGILGIELVLFFGAWYASALGYNYRTITLQLIKVAIEADVIIVKLKAWPHKMETYPDSMPQFCGRKLCVPPEIIKVFWMAFLVSLALVAIVSFFASKDDWGRTLSALGGILGLAGAITPMFRYGKKLEKICQAESA